MLQLGLLPLLSVHLEVKNLLISNAEGNKHLSQFFAWPITGHKIQLNSASECKWDHVSLFPSTVILFPHPKADVILKT